MATSKVPVEETTSSQDGSEVAVPKLLDRYADESYKLLSQVKVEPPTPEEAERIRKKCVRWVIPFICLGYHLMYVDKQTLGNSSILGIIDDTNLTTEQYNWLSSIFYLGYLLAEVPQNMALQRFPVAKYLAVNLVVCFGSLFVVRILLGLAEACIVPSFLIILSMFFTYDEQGVLMQIMWACGNSSPITSGLLSYGVLFIKTGTFAPWKWFMGSTLPLDAYHSQPFINTNTVITGGLTVLYGILVWFLFPDNPASAHFLTKEERAQSILRIASNHSGIEQKRFKKGQFFEALRDPKTWLFFLHAWSQEMANGLTNQYSLIIKSFGFSTLNTTLLGCINGLTALVSLVIALYHVGYGLGNILSPQLFQGKYKPRYIETWWVILWVACVFPMLLVLYLRYYLSKENKRRDSLAQKGEIRETGVVEHVDESGNRTEEVVDARQLDLTDRENLAFRYVL
ncbi:hypothetical protein SLS63_009596 [Diaporthe eres]|uniref:Allantoate permease n=1 Tax=Diaporthe eres TaxID=83184 RepID=A0ABR1NZD7_DIAER